MELVERWPRNLPMRFFIEITQGHGIGQQLIELLSHFQANRFFQFKTECMSDSSELLNFAATLVNSGLCTGATSGRALLCHRYLLLLALDVARATSAQQSF